VQRGGDHVLTFGKYAGVSLDVLWKEEEDPAYVRCLAGRATAANHCRPVFGADLIAHAQALVRAEGR
jgi:hypothetical protein